MYTPYPIESIEYFQNRREQALIDANYREEAAAMVADADRYTEEAIVAADLEGAYYAIDAANDVVLRSAKYIRETELANFAVDEALRTAGTDPLTGLLNRRGFDKEFKHLLDAFNTPAIEEHDQRHQDTQPRVPDAKHSVVAIDLDKFKGINDVYGHDAGDKVLKRVAELLILASRDSDIVARIGGEEIVALLPRTDEEHAHKYSEKIRKIIANDQDLKALVKNEREVTCSSGVYEINPDETLEPEEILKKADKAMYEAKKAGRNMTVKYSEMPSSQEA